MTEHVRNVECECKKMVPFSAREAQKPKDMVRAVLFIWKLFLNMSWNLALEYYFCCIYLFCFEIL